MEKPRDKKREMYETLRREVLTMRLAPGEDLDEVSLSRRFGLSRTPLREVFQQLAGEGYLETRENRGSRVADMGHETLRSFFLAAPMIYSSMSRLAVRSARPHQIEDLKQTQKKFVAALRQGSVEERTLANNRFHEIIGEMANNRYLMQSLKRLLIDHSRIGMTFYRPQNQQMVGNLAKASEQHDELIACIESDDEERAAEITNDHWQLSRGQIEMFVMPGGLDEPLGRSQSPKSA
jgi:DNA-binding GntR family transcriptional regulator